MRILFSELKRNASRPAIFLDRDGVINRRNPDGYVLDWSEFIFIPGIREALKQLAVLNLPMIIISNQAAVGKGLLDPSCLQEITVNMQQMLVSDGSPLAAAYYCTHKREENCPCRKPKPALLQKAAEDFGINLGRSIFVGDSETDLEAAEAANCRPVLFCPGLDSSVVAPRPNLATVHDTTELFKVTVDCLGNIDGA